MFARGARNTASKSRHRTRNILVVTEICGGVPVALICAGLMINTLDSHLTHGARVSIPSHLLTAEVRLTGEKYMNAIPRKNRVQRNKSAIGIFCRQVLERVK